MRQIWIDENTEGAEDGEYHIETGGVRFDEDWPGFFLRGDDALYLASMITSAFAMGDIDEHSVAQLKIYADEIFDEVPYDQWIDENGHSIIQSVKDKDKSDLKIQVHRDGTIARDDKEEGFEDPRGEDAIWGKEQE